MNDADVIVVGAGIIGAACAHRLAGDGLRVLLLDSQSGGATNAGMGHLVCLDDSPAELALCHDSLRRWNALVPDLPADCAWSGCGTLWLAQTPEEMETAKHKAATFRALGIDSHLIGAQALAQLEPSLRPGLSGGLKVPGDSIIYAPNVARWFAANGGANLRRREAEVTALVGSTVHLSDGGRLIAPHILIANGLDAVRLLPELPIRPKKGHLAITDRYDHGVKHQLVELGYGASAHASDGMSVAFNVQPRPTGQLLIGSSRQFDDTSRAVAFPVLRQMLRRAAWYLPDLADMTIIRCWTGLRAASPDGLPLLGEHPSRPGIWLAVGHEGLGVTTAPATAEILSALMTGRRPSLDPSPYLASRYLDAIPAKG